MRTLHFLLSAAFLTCSTAVSAQNTIYSYAIGNWRTGPTVEISPLFETTEMFTTPQLIAWVRHEWPESFTDTTDIDVQRFATIEEGSESRSILKAKYGVRKLPVHVRAGPHATDTGGTGKARHAVHGRTPVRGADHAKQVAELGRCTPPWSWHRGTHCGIAHRLGEMGADVTPLRCTLFHGAA
ncbi:MAG: hypothetical protein IPF78_06465 [Flavobacteriales bacterium]|nr:hypothetical protein [Flavobacteriales bacterium]